MTALLLFTALLQDQDAGSIALEPTDDVWVYQFAEDQVSDPYLRVWGSEEGPVGTSFEGHLPFSYSCLKFTLPKKEDHGPLLWAKLVLTHAGEPSWTKQDAEKNPLEARALGTNWEEETWTYEMAQKVHPVPDRSTVYGSGFASPSDQPFPITIELTGEKGVFKADFQKAEETPSRELGIALTSSLRPEGAGESTIYKLFSRNGEAATRPKLILAFSNK